MNEQQLELIPLYALGALSDEEAEQVEALLQSDPEAQRLLAEYQVVTENLLLSVPQQSSASASGALLRAHLRPRRRWPYVVLAAAAALAIIVLATVIASNLGNGDENQAPSTATLFEELATNDDSTLVSIRALNDLPLDGEMVIAADRSQAVIRINGLEELEPTETYQLWLFDASGSNNGGLFSASDPTTYLLVPLEGEIDRFRRFGVSVEPAGGSPRGNRASGRGVFVVDVE